MSDIRFKVLKKWCIEILKGLDYLHSQQPHPIVHRDLKCDNIFINSHKGDIMIGDLGCASILSNQVTGSVLGTPQYMAPEVFDEHYNTSIDIYSFGMCVLEMSTHLSPYYECKGNPYQIYKKLNTGIKPTGLQRVENKDLKAFIDKCIGPAASRPTAAALLEDDFLQPNELDNQVIITLPEPKKTEKVDRSIPDIGDTGQGGLEETEGGIKPTSPPAEITTPAITPMSINIPIPDIVPKLQAMRSSHEERRTEYEVITSKNTSTRDLDGKSALHKRRQSRSLRNFRETSAEDNEKDDSGTKKGQGTTKTPNNGLKDNSRGPIKQSTTIGEAQLSKKEKLSMIEDVKLEFRGDELHIFNDREEIENVPIDSLKVSTIHDISRNILDKLHFDTIDQDDQFLLESKIGSALRFKELAASSRDAKKLTEKETTRENEHETQDKQESLSDVVSNSEDDLLMIQIQAFERIYNREYLDKVLLDTWRDEGMHQMNLRHEAELNELKKMHTHQKQELLNEMRRRKDRVKMIEQRMKKDLLRSKKDFQEQESSHFMELDSYSVRSKDLSFRGSFLNQEPLAHLTDNLSRIVANREHEYIQRDDQDLINYPLFSDYQKVTSGIYEDTRYDTKNKVGSSELLPGEDKKKEENIDQDKSTLPVYEHANSSSFVISPIHKSVKQDEPLKDIIINPRRDGVPIYRYLPLHQLSQDDLKHDQLFPQSRTQRTCEERGENKSSVYKNTSEEISSMRNLSSVAPLTSVNTETILENLEKLQLLEAPIGPEMPNEKDREKDIILLQQSLRILYPDSDVFANGKFAKFTQRLVIKFQESKSLRPDGVVDQETWTAIRGSTNLHRKRDT